MRLRDSEAHGGGARFPACSGGSAGRTLPAVLLLLASCATPPRPRPTMQSLEFAGGRATWRELARPEALCEAEPRFLLDELSSVNEVLRRFEAQVRGDEPASWTDARIRLVEDGAEVLPSLMALHERTLSALERCSFARTSAFPSVAERGRELISAVRARLAAAPGIVARIHAQRALEEWRTARLLRQDAARAGCPTRARRPTVYFAWRDETGRTSWLFCDDAAVVMDGDGTPWLDPPPDELRRRPAPVRHYLDAASRFPAASIERAPDDQEAAVSVW